MFFPTLIALIPQLFDFGKDVSNLFDGTATEDEWNEVLSDVEKMANSIPEVKAFTVLISASINVLRVAIPMFEKKNATSGLMSTDDGDTVDDMTLTQAKASLRILETVANKIEERNNEVASAEEVFDPISSVTDHG